MRICLFVHACMHACMHASARNCGRKCETTGPAGQRPTEANALQKPTPLQQPTLTQSAQHQLHDITQNNHSPAWSTIMYVKGEGYPSAFTTSEVSTPSPCSSLVCVIVFVTPGPWAADRKQSCWDAAAHERQRHHVKVQASSCACLCVCLCICICEGTTRKPVWCYLSYQLLAVNQSHLSMP
jgi:hypothetical protein